MACAAIVMLSPTLVHGEQGWRWCWPDAAPWHLVGAPHVTPKPTDSGLYTPPFEHVVTAVLANSGPSDILWSNASYVLGFVGALAHRPISSAMLDEVHAEHAADPLSAAQVIVWFKITSGQGFPGRAVLAPYRLKPVAETDMAVIFRKQETVAPAHRPRAAMPLGVALGALCVALVGIVWDLRKPRHPGEMPV